MFGWMKKHMGFEDLNRLVDGELAGGSLRRAERHLAGCAACGGKIAELRRVSESVGEWGAEAEDAKALWPQIEEAIRRRKKIRLSWRERFGVTLPVFVMRPALALSVAVLLGVFTLVIFERMTLADNEATLNSVSSENKLVMIFKTKERKITVIWLTDLSRRAGQPHVTAEKTIQGGNPYEDHEQTDVPVRSTPF